VTGALKLKAPSDLLQKLRYEVGQLKLDPYNTYIALDAARDAHHLCDWVWAGCMHDKPELQQAVMKKSGTRGQFVTWIASNCPRFRLITELSNGSKHFGDPREGPAITHTYEGGWGRQYWGEGVWGAPAALVVVTEDGHLSIVEILNDAVTFWDTFFEEHNIP
jgi:hypothetical protein